MNDCIFADLAEEERSHVCRFIQPLRYERDQIVWQEGVYRPGFYILCEGSAVLFVRSLGGKRRTVKSFHPGDTISVCSGTDLCDFVAQVVSNEASVISHIPGEEAKSLATEYPSIIIHAMRKLSRLTLHLLHELAAASYDSVRARVARVLLELAQQGQLENHYSQQTIAEMIGASREAVNKVIHAMAAEGIVRVQSRQIKIVNEQRLQDTSL